MLTIVTVIIHTVHELPFLKCIRLHLTSIEIPHVLVLLKDKCAVTQTLAKVLDGVEQASIKSHVKRVFSI